MDKPSLVPCGSSRNGIRLNSLMLSSFRQEDPSPLIVACAFRFSIIEKLSENMASPSPHSSRFLPQTRILSGKREAGKAIGNRVPSREPVLP